MIRSNVISATTAAGVAVFAILAVARFAQAQAGPERQFLIEEDLAIPGYRVALAEATLGVGEREGKHTHPGTLVGRILEGELTMEQEGGINTGNVPVKALVTFILEKDKPLATPAP
jgi:hypothetical protein